MNKTENSRPTAAILSASPFRQDKPIKWFGSARPLSQSLHWWYSFAVSKPDFCSLQLSQIYNFFLVKIPTLELNIVLTVTYGKIRN